MNSQLRILFTCVLITLLSPISGQESFEEYKDELKELDRAPYVSKAFEGAEFLAKKGDYKDALDLVEKGIKKSKSLGSGALTVVYLNKARLLADHFPKEDNYVKEIIESFKKIANNNPPIPNVEDAIQIGEPLVNSVSDEMKPLLVKQLESLRRLISNREQEIITRKENKKLEDFKKLDDKEVLGELEKLKSERERLGEIQVKLSEAIDRSQEELSERAEEINSMSRDQAKKEAIIQFNKRMIDSLTFMAQLDSINIISRELLIAEQEAQLELQNSQIQLKDSELQLKSSRQKFYLVLLLLGLLVVGFLSWLFISARKMNSQLALKNSQIEEEKGRSDELLLNILPKFIAQELKENSKVKTRVISQCSVVFTDFINFSNISKMLTPEDLIGALDECFRAFDNIIVKYNIEKIKTIGDSYMCAGGVPVTNSTHAIDAVHAAKDMIAFLDEWNAKREMENKIKFEARIGIHSGPIITGVVGIKKFAYDIWGDTVNVAARIEEQSSASRINVSESTYQLIKDHYQCIKRGSIKVKNMPPLEMYYVDEVLVDPILN